MAASTATAAIAIGEARSFELSIDRELDDDLSFGDTWKTQLSGPLSWSVSYEANMDSTQTTAFTAATSVAAPVNWYGYPSAGSTTQYYYGTIWVSIDGLGGDVMSVGKYSVNGVGDGALSAN